ncbi:MAG: hypothetical protein ACRC4M_00900 [Mycoplasma sp.]
MEDKKEKTIADRVQEGEDLQLSELEYENAVKKEEHFRNLYNEIFDFNSTKNFNELCGMLITGYEKLMTTYASKQDQAEDVSFIIKFAFRDFFLLMFINMKSVFDNDEFLKTIHKKVYSSANYVEIQDFVSLIDYCKEKVKLNESKQS